MRLDWRTVSGPVATAALAVAIFVVDRRVVAVPDAASFCIGAVAISAAIGGSSAGLVSAVTTILFTMLFLMPYGPPAVTGIQLARLATVCITAPAAAITIGLLHAKFIDVITRERERRSALEQLSGALDEMDIGVVLLDTDTRAQFINRAFREMFRLSEQQARSKPPFVALMYHGRDTHAYRNAGRRTRFIHLDTYRAGSQRRPDTDRSQADQRPGAAFPLRGPARRRPHGLSYMPITDLIRRTDDPADRDILLAQRGARGNGEWITRHPARTLRAAEQRPSGRTVDNLSAS